MGLALLTAMLMAGMQEDPAVFQQAMAATGEALIQAAEDVLSVQNAPQLEHGGQLDEYGQFLVATMGIWGYSHVASLPESSKMRFLQLVIPRDYVLPGTGQEYWPFLPPSLPPSLPGLMHLEQTPYMEHQLPLKAVPPASSSNAHAAAVKGRQGP